MTQKIDITIPGTGKLSIEGDFSFVPDVALPPPPPPPPPNPTPAPDPLPPGSPNVSIVTQNMTPQAGGYYRAVLGQSGDGENNRCYVQTRLKVAPRPGQTIRVTHRERTNVMMSKMPSGANVKDRRNNPGSYPNDYEARDGADGTRKITTEPGDGSVLNFREGKPWTVAWCDYPFKPDQWQTIVKTYKFATAPGLGDGSIKIVVDGEEIFNRSNWRSDTVRQPGTRSDFGSQMVLANSNGEMKFPAGTYYEAYAPVVEILS